MKIDILGYWGGFPIEGGATAGYLITTREGRFLIDCGSGVMSKLSLKARAEELDAVILSHLHYDHMGDVGVLQYAMNGALRTGRAKEKIKMYSPAEPIVMWKQIQSAQSENVEIDDSTSLEIAGAKIEFQSVQHTIPCYAVRITYKDKVFVYSADSEYVESLTDFAKNADVFICEATICEGSTHTVGAGHMDARDAAKIAREANVGKLILTHLPSDGNFELMKQQATEVFGEEVFLAMETEHLILE
ncbi:MBL fold metallo-hydrolase [Oceanobacillus piezotolerans]|uniref:MBL fold metallo-hydrolase n=1 Tax=Oceanobacillus piezotolerans TaxID=2448030 RepID=A0A498DD66_9BACI|nr:MBL fold metallo-hydrolase [Oceanobacillus piezotolerans]RLL46907.1 MBL fold metallo-hydrolase [Oceanobacillus piezotolerans]